MLGLPSYPHPATLTTAERRTGLLMPFIREDAEGSLTYHAVDPEKADSSVALALSDRAPVHLDPVTLRAYRIQGNSLLEQEWRQASEAPHRPN